MRGEEAAGEHDESDDHPRQALGQRQRQPGGHHQHGDQHHAGPASASAARPATVELAGAGEVGQEHESDHRQRQVERRRHEPVAEVVVDGHEAAHQRERHEQQGQHRRPPEQGPVRAAPAVRRLDLGVAHGLGQQPPERRGREQCPAGDRGHTPAPRGAAGHQRGEDPAADPTQGVAGHVEAHRGAEAPRLHLRADVTHGDRHDRGQHDAGRRPEHDQDREGRRHRGERRQQARRAGGRRASPGRDRSGPPARPSGARPPRGRPWSPTRSGWPGSAPRRTSRRSAGSTGWVA